MTDLTETAARRYQFATGNQKLLGHLAMFAFSAFVAGSYSIGALATPHIGPAAVNAVRFLIGTTLMAVAAWILLKGRIPAPRAAWRFLVLGGLMAVFFVTMFVALRLTDPVSTGAVFTLMPLMSAFFGYLLLGQVPRGIAMASLVFACLGSIWVIFNGDLDALLAFDVGEGEMIFFVGVVCHAVYAPLVKRLNRGEPLVAFTLWSLLATGLCIALYGAREIMDTDWGSLPPIVWISVAYLAIFTTAGTTFLVQFAAMRLPAAKVLAYTYLTPCYIILFEGLLGHGWARPSVAAGAIVTVLGLLVLAFSRDA
ncbi:DMT family transporter [Aquamicrobium sp. LC103]|uniref:DMT family transporter n=1 Tax=Aquamicrobium sp. LC103 TaxID=1120658 RepID=UPI000A9A3F42|nr:DMT family transporter [Aquamicrobium sp. LC103]